MEKNNELKKVVLTGGHAATTALAVVEELIRRNQKKPIWDIYWIGAKRALEGKNVPTLESQVFSKIGVTHHHIVAGRIQRKFTIWTIPSFAKIPIGFLHAYKILTKIKPDIILSFGGYAAFPVVVIGWLKRIPIIIHDQTSIYGLSNKFSAPFAKKITLARQESLKYFDSKKVVMVGNPIMTQIAEILPKKSPDRPATIYVTAGSRGSMLINSVIKKIAPDLLKDYRIIHQTGHLDFDTVRQFRDNLKPDIQKNYQIYPTIDPMQVDNVYRSADLVIARAGANTVSEIIAVRRPSILIPLALAYKDEQTKNAEIAKRIGIAKIINESDLTAERLLSEIKDTFKNWNKIVARGISRELDDKNAAKRLVDVIEEVS